MQETPFPYSLSYGRKEEPYISHTTQNSKGESTDEQPETGNQIQVRI